MQSAPVSSQAPHAAVPARKSVFYAEETYRERNDLTIEYSGKGGDLFLHMSTDVSYTSSFYTEEGYLPSQALQSVNNAALLNSSPVAEGNDTAPTVNQTSQLFDMALQKYHDLIRQQIAYLLGEITNQQEGTTSGSDENPVESSDAAPSSYTEIMYTESLSVSQSLTVSGTITDPAYFSAEKTAERIISFALSFYDGGDRDAYTEMVRDAVMKGFDEAMAAFGGFLPQEAYDTINLVNQAIDRFADENVIDLSI